MKQAGHQRRRSRGDIRAAFATLVVAGFCAAPLAGCAALGRHSVMPDRADRCGEQPVPAASTPDGSLYVPGSGRGMLFGEQRVHRVCDQVTILVAQEASATQEVQTVSGRASSISLGVSALAGLEKSIANLNPNVNMGALIGADAENSFDGGGSTRNTNTVRGALAARVIEVLPNGFLRLYGEVQTKVNSDVQVLALTGVVDPRSVSAQDTVVSEALFDARIELSNLRGPNGEASRVPWGTRLINVVSPF